MSVEYVHYILIHVIIIFWGSGFGGRPEEMGLPRSVFSWKRVVSMRLGLFQPLETVYYQG